MEPRESAPQCSPKTCLHLVAENLLQIDSFRTMYVPGNSNMTVYMELGELKITLETLEVVAPRFFGLSGRQAPHTVTESMMRVLSLILSTLRLIDFTLTAETWNALLLKLYQFDFTLSFQCHQLQELSSLHYSHPCDLLCTPESRNFWDKHFGAQWFVPWATFWSHVWENAWAESNEERAVKHFLDFCADGCVSPFELCLFTKWFGPLELAFRNLISTLKAGLLVGAIPASEANSLLKGKMAGSFLVRFSKTRPGCFAITVSGDSGFPRHFLLNYLEPGKFSMQQSPAAFNSIHHFVHSQPRLKYPVTTRFINDLLVEPSPTKSSVEIHTSTADGAQDAPHSSTSSSTGSRPPYQQTKLNESRDVYDAANLPDGAQHLPSAMGPTLHQRITAAMPPILASGFNPLAPPSLPQQSPLAPPSTQAPSSGFGPVRSAPSNIPSSSPPPVFGFMPIRSPQNTTQTAPTRSKTQQRGASSFESQPTPSFTSPNIMHVPTNFNPVPMGFGPSPPIVSTSPSSTQPFGFLPVQRSGTSTQQPIPFPDARSSMPATTSTLNHVPFGSNAAQTTSLSPTERNAPFFPLPGGHIPPNIVQQHQEAPNLRRSSSQQLRMATDGTNWREASLKRAASSQLRAGGAVNLHTGDGNAWMDEGSRMEVVEDDLFANEGRIRRNTPLDICVICLDRERSTVFLDCSHMLCCAECSHLVAMCPICRQPIKRVIPVYRS